MGAGTGTNGAMKNDEWLRLRREADWACTRIIRQSARKRKEVKIDLVLKPLKENECCSYWRTYIVIFKNGARRVCIGEQKCFPTGKCVYGQVCWIKYLVGDGAFLPYPTLLYSCLAFLDNQTQNLDTASCTQGRYRSKSALWKAKQLYKHFAARSKSTKLIAWFRYWCWH